MYLVLFALPYFRGYSTKMAHLMHARFQVRSLEIAIIMCFISLFKQMVKLCCDSTWVIGTPAAVTQYR